MSKSHTSFDERTTADQAAQTFGDQIQGKTVLITGVSPNGLGAETARTLASHGVGLLICTGRDRSKVEQVFDAILRETPRANLRYLHLDLSSLESCQAASKTVLGYPESLDILIGNAGTMACPESKTQDGFEFQFGSNHLGHFQFFNLLIPKVIESPSEGKRIIMVSSRAHIRAGINFECPGYLDRHKGYDKWNAYGQSKTANMLYSLSLSRKLESQGVLSFSLHPGAIPSTSLGRSFEEEELKAIGVLDSEGQIAGTYLVDGNATACKSITQGTSTIIVAAFSPFLAKENGQYLVDCNISNDSAAAHAKDEIKAELLWKLSESLIGTNFNW